MARKVPFSPKKLRRAFDRAPWDTTQRGIAAQVGIHEVTISKYLSGSRSPRYRTLVRLADALNVKPEDLMEDDAVTI